MKGAPDKSGRAFVPTGSSPQAVSPVPASIPSAGDLKVWWIPQLPMAPFEVRVPDLQTAALLLDTLAAYDAFQFENNVKPDYCNAGGLMVYEVGADGGDWFDWWDDATGMDFDEMRREPNLLAQDIEPRRSTK